MIVLSELSLQSEIWFKFSRARGVDLRIAILFCGKKAGSTKFLPGTSLCSGGPKRSLVGGGVRLRCKAGSTKGFVGAESEFQKKKSKAFVD